MLGNDRLVFIAAGVIAAAVLFACGDREAEPPKGTAENNAPTGTVPVEPETRSHDGAVEDDRWASFSTTDSGLKYEVIHAADDGPKPNQAATVRVKYTGMFDDGTVFDSSEKYGPAINFVLCRAIPWWVDGLRLMTAGSKFKFVVPPHLAFGEKGNPPHVPPNATLIYEVELIEFEQGPELPPFHPRNPGAEKKTGSGLVHEMLEPGEGEPPGDGDRVDVIFAVWTTEGRLVDCSEMQRRPKRFVVGKERFKVFNEGTRLLRPGARCRFEVPPALGFGSRGFGNLVKGDTDTVWELELVRFVESPRFTMPSAEELVTTESGLKYHVVEKGDGPSPEMEQDVIVDYTGWLADGTPFDSSHEQDQPATFEIGRVIEGWNEGLQLMAEGAVYIFVIPPELAYAERGAGKTIPPNATLVFHVELLQVLK